VTDRSGRAGAALRQPSRPRLGCRSTLRGTVRISVRRDGYGGSAVTRTKGRETGGPTAWACRSADHSQHCSEWPFQPAAVAAWACRDCGCGTGTCRCKVLFRRSCNPGAEARWSLRLRRHLLRRRPLQRRAVYL